MYTIKTVAALTGLGTETLRAWERRYETIAPKRDGNGRRFYSQEDVERLIVLAKLTRQGHTISKLSTLDPQQLKSLLTQKDKQNTGQQQNELVVQIINKLKAYQIQQCEELLKRALVAYEPRVYVRDILLPALQQVGDLWHEKQLSVAQEHLFSGCVKRIVLSLLNNTQSQHEGRPGILFAAPSGEVHEFGILMGSFLAASQQYNCYYLGSDLPGTDMVEAAQHLKPQVLVLSLVVSPPAAETLTELDTLKTALPDTVQVWLGGEGAKQLHANGQLPDNWQFIEDIDQFCHRIEHMRVAAL